MMKSARILLVDDDLTGREMVARRLRSEGYEVSEAENGRAALALARERLPDLVLLNVPLPDWDGAALCRRLKSDGALSDVFIVLISGANAGSLEAAPGSGAGADDYMIRPVDPAELAARVRILARSQHANAMRGAVLRSLPDAIVTIDERGRIVQFNAAAEKMFGSDRTRAIGKEMAEVIICPALREWFRAGLANAFASDDGPVAGSRMGLTALRADGSEFPVELAIVRVESPGPMRFTALIRDISRHKFGKEELARLTGRIMKAQESERLRVARDLHDGVNPIIASARMRLMKLEGRLGGTSPAARETLRRCCELLENALDENRRIAHNLRPKDLDELGLSAACRNLCKAVESRTNLAVKCRFARIDRRLARELELNLFRIVQEGLSNVERHARASAVQVRLEFRGDAIVLKIHDDGRGFNPKAGNGEHLKRRGVGLTNMRERAALLGGVCEVVSAPKRGTSLTVLVPAALPKPPAKA